MPKAMSETTPHACVSKAAGGPDGCLIETCTAFQECVAAFGQKISAMDAMVDDYDVEQDPEDLLASALQLRAEWQAIAGRITGMPARHPAGEHAKADALHAYFVHVGCTFDCECIGLGLARSLVDDLRSARDRSAAP